MAKLHLIMSISGIGIEHNVDYLTQLTKIILHFICASQNPNKLTCLQQITHSRSRTQQKQSKKGVGAYFSNIYAVKFILTFRTFPNNHKSCLNLTCCLIDSPLPTKYMVHQARNYTHIPNKCIFTDDFNELFSCIHLLHHLIAQINSFVLAILFPLVSQSPYSLPACTATNKDDDVTTVEDHDDQFGWARR